MDKSQQKRVRNDFAPQFLNGRPTEAQITNERTALFFYLLRGLGMPRQVVRFVHVIFTHAKPGKLYNFNDLYLADALGCDGSPTTRNYVVNLRKKLREWNNTFYDEIVRTKHFSFVSIQENEFDTKTKTQIPTGYIVSSHFVEILESLILQVRGHYEYKNNWPKAVREVCKKAAREGRLSEVGLWDRRKEKRPRPVEDILGTLLLNWKRLTRKLVQTGAEFGIRPEWIVSELQKVAPGYINLAADPWGLTNGPKITVRVPSKDPLKYFVLHDLDGNELREIPVRYSESEFAELWKRVFRYVSERENPAAYMPEQPIFNKSRLRGLTDESSIRERYLNNGQGRNSGQAGAGGNDLGQSSISKFGIDPGFLQTGADNENMDPERIRYLERISASGGANGKE